MRDFLVNIAIPTIGSFIVVMVCIGIVIFGAAVLEDFISDPTTIFAEQIQ